MEKRKKSTLKNYTCNEYREEMILLGLRKQLQNPELSKLDKDRLLKEIARLEKLVGFE